MHVFWICSLLPSFYSNMSSIQRGRLDLPYSHECTWVATWNESLRSLFIKVRTCDLKIVAIIWKYCIFDLYDSGHKLPDSPTSHPSCFSAAGYASSGAACTSEDKSFVVIKARQVGGHIQVSKKGCGGSMTKCSFHVFVHFVFLQQIARFQQSRLAMTLKIFISGYTGSLVLTSAELSQISPFSQWLLETCN